MATLTKKVLGKISEMTAINDHGGAYQLAAQTLGRSDLAEQFGTINRRQQELGYLPIDLYGKRHGLYDSLLTHAKSMLSATDYQALYRSL